MIEHDGTIETSIDDEMFGELPTLRKPCPFCGSTDTHLTQWVDDQGEFDAIECNVCLGAAPYDRWNDRSIDA